MYKKYLSWVLSTVLLTGGTALQGNPQPAVSLADEISQIVGLCLEPMPDGSLREGFMLNGDPYMSTLTRMN